MESRMFGGGGGMMPPGTDAPVQGGQAPMPGGVMSPSSIRGSGAFTAQSQIHQLEQQLLEMQRDYQMAAARTNNPQQLASMQFGLQQLQSQIEWAKQQQRQKYAMEALKMNQRANMPGAGSMGTHGRGGDPNQNYINQSQILQMMAGMFGGGSGADRNW